jgi:hypothetical protein
MKKIIVIAAVAALAAMLAFPAILFAEEGDTNSTIGLREQEGEAGQYILGNKDPDAEQPNDTINDSSTAEINNGSQDGAAGDGDTEAFCIDGDTTWDTGKDEYTLTDIDVSDELLGESAPLDDDDNDGTSFKNDSSAGTVGDHKEDGVIDPVEAEAVEILSKEATGAGSVEDQESVWLETGDKNHNRGDAGTKEAITGAAEALATEFLNLGVNNDGDPDNDMTLDEFLDEKAINEIDVTVEQDDAIFDEDSPTAGTATAIMENPLVPGVTDDGKDVYWYILGGAFNISFSPDELVTEASSLDNSDGTNAAKMNDEEDDNDGENSLDNDGDGSVAGDHYGIATIDYYYYHWGLAEYPEDTMGINLFAWVDVDEDGLFDIVDIDPEKAADGQDPDGDVVGDFQDNHQVVQTEDDGSGKQEVKTDTDGNVETEPFDTKKMDIHKVEGGKVVLGHDDLTAAEEEDPLTILPRPESERAVTKQRFSTISYDEPYDDDPIYFGTIVIKVDESEKGLKGAVFGIYDNEDTSGDPIETVTSDENGFVSTSGLIWEGSGNTYYMKELSAPAGYDKDNTLYEISISGHGVTVTNGDSSESIPFMVVNEKTPPDDPEDPEDPDTPEEVIEVEGFAGLKVLAFTGTNTAVPLTGIAMLVISLAIFILTAIARKKSWKHVLRRR